MAAKSRKQVSLGRSSRRKDNEVVWYENDASLVAEINNLPNNTTSFRMIYKDGSCGWRHQKARPSSDVNLDEFVTSCNLDPSTFMKSDMRSPIYKFATFLVEECEQVTESGMMWIEATLWVPGLDKSIKFKGKKGISSRIAKARFYHAFNREYPGCHLDMDGEEVS